MERSVKVISVELRRSMSLDEVVREVERVKTEMIERIKVLESRRRVSKSTYLVTLYCPRCLRTYEYTSNQLRRVKSACTICRVELKILDEEFKRRYVELLERFASTVKAVLEPTWSTLRSWWIETGAEAVPCEVDAHSVTVFFETPSHLKIYIENGEVRAYMYLHWLSQDQLEKLESVINTLRDAKLTSSPP
jgi:RNase P subunit RPR2